MKMANNYGKKVVEVKKEKTEVMFQVGTKEDVQAIEQLREVLDTITKFGKTYNVYSKTKQILNSIISIQVVNNIKLEM